MQASEQMGLVLRAGIGEFFWVTVSEVRRLWPSRTSNSNKCIKINIKISRNCGKRCNILRLLIRFQQQQGQSVKQIPENVITERRSRLKTKIK